MDIEIKRILELIKEQQKCWKCGEICYPYPTCKKCYKIIEKECKKLTEKEFYKQLQLPEEQQSEYFKQAEFEVWHNNCYEPLSEEEYFSELADAFIEEYYEPLLKAKLHNKELK